MLKINFCASLGQVKFKPFFSAQSITIPPVSAVWVASFRGFGTEGLLMLGACYLAKFFGREACLAMSPAHKVEYYLLYCVDQRHEQHNREQGWDRECEVMNLVHCLFI